MSQNFSFLALMVWELRFFEDLEENDQSVTEIMNELIIDKAVCRTALATLGLLVIYTEFFFFYSGIVNSSYFI